MKGPPTVSTEPPIDRAVISARWLNLGNCDPRLPPARLIEFTSSTFEPSAFERHGIARPANLRSSVLKRQAEFLAGRLAARQAIERLGLVPSTVGVGPFREPRWQAGVIGSISHTHELAASVVVPALTARGVGIDVENVAHADTLEAIRQTAMTCDEQDLLDLVNSDIPPEMLTTLAFSAKESFFKGAFPVVGRYFDFSAVQVSHIDVASGQLNLTLMEELCPDLPEGRAFPLGFTFISTTTVATSFIW